MSNPQSIQFRVFPSPETNDFEVRIFVSGRDLIRDRWPDMMGADPDEVLSFDFLAPRETPHEALVARCNCGVSGCGSVEVRISSEGDRVVWEECYGEPARGKLIFDREQYLRALGQAVGDTSWETPDRTAARLLASMVDRDALAVHNLKFDWASGRASEGKFTVSLLMSPPYNQIFVHTTWRGESPEQLAQNVAALLREHPSQWPDVWWNGPSPTPPFDGPGWRG